MLSPKQYRTSQVADISETGTLVTPPVALKSGHYPVS
jgi:hypothetical protein